MKKKYKAIYNGKKKFSFFNLIKSKNKKKKEQEKLNLSYL